MKIKLTTLFLSITLLASFAQPVLKYNSHAPKNGDHHHFIITNNVNEGTSGPNQIWDYSSLTKTNDLISNMINTQQTDFSKDIPQSNTVIEEFNNKFFFKSTGNKVEYLGVIGCGNAITKYDEKPLKLVFPFEYGDNYTGPYSGTISSNGINTPINGVCSLNADAWGTLILPGNVKFTNVLRLQTIHTETSGACDYSTITYRWYSAGVRYPLLTIIKSEAGGKSTVIRTAYYADASEELKKAANPEQVFGIKLKNTSTPTMDLSPNPYENQFKISYVLYSNALVSIRIVDNAGRVVFDEKIGHQELGSYEKIIDASSKGLKAGLYHVLLFADEQIITKDIIQVK